MADQPHYENAPVILGILQFRYAPLKDFEIARVKQIASTFKKNFPNVEEKYSQGILINNEKNETNISLDKRKFEGVQIVSEDKSKVFVITPEKFTFQMKGKYSGWEDFTKDTKTFWNTFSENFGLEQLEGISLRYVNRFNLPLDLKDLKTYFTTYLEDKKNDFKISNYQFRFSSFDQESDFNINIGHSLENPTPENVPYIFDIDVLKNVPIKNKREIVWEEFEKIRLKKNEIFNKSITEETIKLIK